MLKHNYIFGSWPEAPWKVVAIMKHAKLYLVSLVVVLVAGLIGQFVGPSIDAWVKERVGERIDAYWLPRIADCIDNGGETTVLSIERHPTISGRIIIIWAENWPERTGRETAIIKAREHWQRLFGCTLNYGRWGHVSLVRVRLGIVNVLTAEQAQPTATIDIVMIASREIALQAMAFQDETLFDWFVHTSQESEAKLSLDLNMAIYDFKLTAGVLNRGWRLAFERR